MAFGSSPVYLCDTKLPNIGQYPVYVLDTVACLGLSTFDVFFCYGVQVRISFMFRFRPNFDVRHIESLNHNINDYNFYNLPKVKREVLWINHTLGVNPKPLH